MKLRNQLLALFCLLVFIAFGVFYVRLWVLQKPFGIILFVSDGMVVNQLAAARLYEGGAAHHLGLESFPNLALLSNSARDFAIADDAAAATALATGTKVNHRIVSFDTATGKPLESILELAREQGRSVGLVTTGQFTDPSSAAFYAHIADCRDTDQIALQFASKPSLDVVLAGGAAEFLPENANGRRKDQRNLLNELKAKGRECITTKAELENASAFRTGGIIGLFAPGALAYGDQIEAVSAQPSLADMVRRGIEFLQLNRNGYVLIVDESLSSRAAESNSGERTLNETLALDKAIATAGKYAGEKSLIVAVGRKAVGGLSLNGYPARQTHGVALTGTAAAGHPSLTWATGPNGPGSKTEPSAFQLPVALPTVEDVVAIGKGEGSEKLHGFMENTEIFGILKDEL